MTRRQRGVGLEASFRTTNQAPANGHGELLPDRHQAAVLEVG
jgi:hypothetical protein